MVLRKIDCLLSTLFNEYGKLIKKYTSSMILEGEKHKDKWMSVHKIV
jgi:hypothetical protein